MPATLYLDTARLGPISPMAQRMLHDFSRLTSEDPASLYLDDFLRHGFESLSSDLQTRFADLSEWPGLVGLKQSLRQFVGAACNSPMLLAGRSRSLMKLAARCLFRHCRNVLTTDLSWPAYQSVLEDEARRTGHGVTQVAVRQRLFRHEINLDHFALELASAARRHRCDGLFLPAVDNLGIRLHVADIVAAIRERTDLKFVCIDAAQAIGHVPLSSDLECSDLVIAGTHKWLGGYLPLGLAFANKPRTQTEIVATCRVMHSQSDLDDPLLDFLTDLESDSLSHHSETINLTPLLTCCGALHDFQQPDCSIGTTLPIQLRNAELVRTLAIAAGWNPLLAPTDQRTSIVLLQSDNPHVRSQPTESLRRSWHQAGVAVTAYDDGFIRLSMPKLPLTAADQERIRFALQTTQESNSAVVTRNSPAHHDGSNSLAAPLGRAMQKTLRSVSGRASKNSPRPIPSQHR